MELWVKYKGRESIVERFKAKGRQWVREIWPLHEPREHAVQWAGAGYEVLPRKVYMTTDDIKPAKSEG